MRRIIYFSLFLFFTLSSVHSQNKIITFKSEGQVKKISFDNKHELWLLTSSICEKERSGGQFLIGTGIEYTLGNIVFKPKRQKVFYADLSKKESKETTYNESVVPLTFSMNQIVSLGYQSNARKQIRNAGKWLMGLGLITSFVVAPLISLKSKSGFNASKYYSTAGIGLLALGVSIPLVSISEYKKYAFENYDNKERRIWKSIDP